jgi:hypothetical protein
MRFWRQGDFNNTPSLFGAAVRPSGCDDATAGQLPVAR